MTLAELFEDKALKTKAKAKQIGAWLLTGELRVDELLAFAEKGKGTQKATCVEGLEYATRKNAGIADLNLLMWMADTLNEEAPRIKWECAKVIGNIVKQFPTKLSKPTTNLLKNAEHEGVVVRWAMAFALAEILKLESDQNKRLLLKIQALYTKETDNGVRRKYFDALNQVKGKM